MTRLKKSFKLRCDREQLDHADTLEVHFVSQTSAGFSGTAQLVVLPLKSPTTLKPGCGKSKLLVGRAATNPEATPRPSRTATQRKGRVGLCWSDMVL
eukprot:2828060-Amphidinium_carterae.1